MARHLRAYNRVQQHPWDCQYGDTLTLFAGIQQRITFTGGISRITIQAEGGEIYYTLNDALVTPTSPGYIPDGGVQTIGPVANLDSLAILSTTVDTKAHLEICRPPGVDGGVTLVALPAWTPADATTDGGLLPEHWYRSDGPLWQDAGITPAVANGDPVGRWEDLTANADHVNQAVAGRKPTIQAGPNGRPAIRFDGVADHVTGAFTTGGALSQPTSVFVVCQLAAGSVDDGNSHYFMDGDDAATNFMEAGQISDPAADRRFMYAGAVLKGTATTGNWEAWLSLWNGGASYLWINGVLDVGPGNAGALNADGFTLGGRVPLSQMFPGDIVEAIIYGANLSNADKNQVGQYLATLYGLAYTDI